GGADLLGDPLGRIAQNRAIDGAETAGRGFAMQSRHGRRRFRRADVSRRRKALESVHRTETRVSQHARTVTTVKLPFPLCKECLRTSRPPPIIGGWTVQPMRCRMRAGVRLGRRNDRVIRHMLVRIMYIM